MNKKQDIVDLAMSKAPVEEIPALVDNPELSRKVQELRQLIGKISQVQNLQVPERISKKLYKRPSIVKTIILDFSSQLGSKSFSQYLLWILYGIIGFIGIVFFLMFGL